MLFFHNNIFIYNIISLNSKDNKITITGMIALISTFEIINKTNNDYSPNKLNLS